MCKFSIVFTAAGLFINLAGMFFFFIVILTPFFVCMHFFFEKMRQNVKNEEKTRRKNSFLSACEYQVRQPMHCKKSFFKVSCHGWFFFGCWNETVKRYYTPTVIWNWLKNYNFIQQCSSSLVYSHFIQWFRINTF